MNGYIFVILILAIAVGKLQAVSLEKDLSLTLSEKQALDKFREKVKPILKNDFMKSDIYLIRWIRSQKFDLNAAEKMLKQNLRWREVNKMDSIQKEDFSDLWRDYPATVDTYDKEGRPVGTIEFFDWNIRGAVLAGKGPRLLRYMDMLMDNVTMQVWERQQRGMNVSQWKVLANCETVNMITHGCPACMPLWIQYLTSLETHYPGWMDEIIVVDASPAIYTILNLVRPVLSRQTQDAIKFFGMNKNVWMPYLDARISRDGRRAPYGGSKPPIDRN